MVAREISMFRKVRAAAAVVSRIRSGPVSKADVEFLEGSKRHDVVGESFYQKGISSICGGHSREGHKLEIVAVLRPEPANPHDANAVAVLIDGKQVGHLPRAKAKALQKPLIALERSSGKPVGCRGLIVGGWDRGRNDQGQFGVQLFFDEKNIR